MPDAFKMFVLRTEFAKIDATTTLATGHSASNLLGGNPNVIVTSAAGTCTIKVRLDADTSGNKAANSIHCAGWYFRNPTIAAAFAISTEIKSTEDPTYAAGFTTHLSSTVASGVVAGFPWCLTTFSASDDKYWQFSLTGIDNPEADMSMLILAESFTMSKRWNWGDIDTYDTPSEQANVGYGRTLSRLGTTKQRRIIRRSYEFIDTADVAILRSIIAASYGSHTPMIYVDYDMDTDLSPNEGILCRFGSNRLEERQVAYGLWNVSFDLIELPQLSFTRPY